MYFRIKLFDMLIGGFCPYFTFQRSRNTSNPSSLLWNSDRTPEVAYSATDISRRGIAAAETPLQPTSAVPFR